MAFGQQRRAEALAFYPAVGLVLGMVAGAVAWGMDGCCPAFAGVAGIVVLTVLSASRVRAARGVPGVATAALAFAAKLWSVTVLPVPARTAALLIAPMLGRWAIVVQCYGGVAGSPERAGLAGQARFREFGWASVTAFAVTLAVADAAGLVVLVTAAVTTVVLRLHAHRRGRGMTEGLLVATAELVETAAMVVLALLAARHEPGAALALAGRAR